MKKHQMCWMCENSLCRDVNNLKYTQPVQIQPLLRLPSLWLHATSWASIYPALFLTDETPKEPH